MQFNITFKTIFEYVLKKLVLCIQIRFVSTEKTTRIASRASCVIYRVAFEVSSLTFRTCPSSVEITLERGSNRSTDSIELKIGLDLENWVLHV